MFFFNKPIMADCGHLTRRKSKVKIFGKIEELTLNKGSGSPEYCHDCFAKMVIRCAWCGKNIFPGDSISVSMPRDKNHKFPEYAVYYSKDTNEVVGCLRRDCSDFFNISGHWVAPGKVQLLQIIDESDDIVCLG
jgi:hypothetical protein